MQSILSLIAELASPASPRSTINNEAQSMPDNTAKQPRRVNWGMLLFGLRFSAFALYLVYAIQWSE